MEEKRYEKVDENTINEVTTKVITRVGILQQKEDVNADIQRYRNELITEVDIKTAEYASGYEIMIKKLDELLKTITDTSMHNNAEEIK